MRLHPFMSGIVGLALFVLPVIGQDDSNPTYLALGDSVTFGFNPLSTGGPGTFVGYPEAIADSQHVQHVNHLVNAACPGDTSGSFASELLPDNGCRDYKRYFGLKTTYSGTQLSFATRLLRVEKHIQVVTINLGGNDLRVLQFGCNFDAGCIVAGIQQVVTTYSQNLAGIFHALREDGAYDGLIVLVTYYSPDYQDPVQTGGIYFLNLAATQVANAFGVQVADGFAAFAQASAGFAGKPCDAGLLIPLPGGSCDIHPSAAGRALLAGAVLDVIGKNKK